VVALREAYHASLCDCDDLPIEKVNRSQKVSGLAPLFHQAKQAMIASIRPSSGVIRR
jgi:hypothetical protein